MSTPFDEPWFAELLALEALRRRSLVERAESAGAAAFTLSSVVLVDFLDTLRELPLEEQGYGPGNVANLLRLLRGELRQIDLSALTVRQLYLQGIEAHGASLAGALVSESVFAEAFHYICVALSPDGSHMLTGTTTGEVCRWRVADRQRLETVTGHTGPIMSVSLSEDGRLFCSASQDGSVWVWQADNGRPLANSRP